jgi:hypothetical protein
MRRVVETTNQKTGIAIKPGGGIVGFAFWLSVGIGLGSGFSDALGVANREDDRECLTNNAIFKVGSSFFPKCSGCNGSGIIYRAMIEVLRDPFYY